MMDLALNNNDLIIKNGDISLCADNIHAISQMIKVSIKTISGEWFMDANLGVPYFTHILGKKQSLPILKKAILKAVNILPDIAEVNNFLVQFSQDSRAVKISFHAVLANQQIITINESVGA